MLDMILVCLVGVVDMFVVIVVGVVNDMLKLIVSIGIRMEMYELFLFVKVNLKRLSVLVSRLIFIGKFGLV